MYSQTEKLSSTLVQNGLLKWRTAIGILVLLTLLQFSFAFAQKFYRVETIPNVKLVNNSYVSNPDTILSPVTVDEINTKLTRLENETTVQVAVVAVRSIGNADIFDFAQRLFTNWGIGREKKDNGLLILLVMDQRTVRFHTGYGLEGVLPDALCKEIQMRSMVSSFRIGEYDRGVRDGVDEVVYVLSNPYYRDELMDDSRRQSNGWNEFFPWALFGGGGVILVWYLVLHWTGGFDLTDKKNKKKVPYPEMRMSRRTWLIIFGAFPIGLLVAFHYKTINTDNHILVFCLLLYGYFGLTLLYKRFKMAGVAQNFLSSKNYFAAATFFNEYQVYWLVMAILVPVPFLFLYFQFLARKKFFRNHPRDCKSCGKPLTKLDEKADDQYLKKSQVFEEELKSVDYDVWLCKACNNVQVLNFVNRFSTYEPCPYCSTKAMYTESRHTTVQPTYTSSGTGEQTDKCKFCGKARVTTYSIPKLEQKEDRSSSGGSYSSGSSGGSWGGGSSGGGGASSSW